MLVSKDKIIIRSAAIDDARILTDWWNDGGIMAHAGFPNGLGTTLEKTNEQIRNNKNAISQICIIEVNHIRIGECSLK